MTNSNDPDSDFDQDHKSKTQLKREATEITKLGKKILKMTGNELAKLNLSEQLMHEIQVIKKIRHKTPGYKRQVLHFGKLLRNDENLPQIISDIENISTGSKPQPQKIEEHYNQLIELKTDYIEKLLLQYPQMDRQHLRLLVRKTTKNPDNIDSRFAARLKNYLAEFIN